MQELKIAPLKNIPEIFMSPQGIMKIKGRSIDEKMACLFDLVEVWINEYIVNPPQLTKIDLCFEYCNSLSSKAIIRVLQQLILVKEKGKSLIINWYYEDGDDDILERGQHFASILDVPINFIKI